MRLVVNYRTEQVTEEIALCTVMLYNSSTEGIAGNGQVEVD